ncbi:MAG: hypothetical protein ABI395_01515 [Sphingobium sp.]
MNLTNAVDWLTWGALVLPLMALAWAAWQYVMIQKREEKRQRFDNFFRVMDKIGETGGSLAAKAAAVYELRQYPEYSELIIRFCKEAIPYVNGDSKQILQTEFRLTVEYFENGK